MTYEFSHHYKNVPMESTGRYARASSVMQQSREIILLRSFAEKIALYYVCFNKHNS